MRDWIPFFVGSIREGWKSHREVGSAIPSGIVAVNSVCKKVKSEMRQVVVEYGPGTGPYTRQLLNEKKEILTPDSKLIVIDTRAEYIAYLRNHLHDQRLTIVHGTAENVRSILADAGEEHADVIISGIPYSYIEDEIRERIMTETVEALDPGGKHIVYQVTSAVEPLLQTHFGSVDRSRILFPLNIPGLRIFEATHPKKGIAEDVEAGQEALISPRRSASQAS